MNVVVGTIPGMKRRMPSVGLLFLFCLDRTASFVPNVYRPPRAPNKPRINIVPNSASSDASSSSSTESLSVKEIKAELQERGVSSADCFDKESLISRLEGARDGSIQATEQKPAPVEDEKLSTSSSTGSTADATSGNQSPVDEEALLKEIRSMKVKELKEDLGRRNIRWAGLLEKEDLVQAVLKARIASQHFSATGLLTPGQVSDLTGEQLEVELAAMAGGTPFLLLDAYAVWCGPCKMMAPQLAQAAEVFGDRVRVAKMDTDQHPQQASQWRVQGLPTLILFRNGQEVDRIEGALMKHQLVEWVESKL
jgi:thioredoxin